jgi:hypothetical protein
MRLFLPNSAKYFVALLILLAGGRLNPSIAGRFLRVKEAEKHVCAGRIERQDYKIRGRRSRYREP